MAVDREPQENKLILEKQIIDDLLENRPAFSGRSKFITVFQGLPICSFSEAY